MKRIALFLFACFIAVPVFAQSPAVIQCAPQSGIKTVPVYGTAQAVWTVDTVSCDQPVSLLTMEQGYAKIRFGERTGYVDAKFVRLLQSQPEIEKRVAALEAQTKAAQQAAKPQGVPEQKPPATKKATPRGPSNTKISVGGWVGYTHPLEKKQKGGLAVGGNFDYRIIKPLVVEVRAWSMKRHFRAEDKGLSEGTLSAAAAQFSLFYHFDLRVRWALNLGGGGGYYFARKFDLGRGLAQSWNTLGFTIIEKLESAPGFHAGGSVDFRLTKKLGVNLDVRYCRVTSKGSWSQKDQISSETISGTFDHVKLDMVIAGIGFKYSF